MFLPSVPHVNDIFVNVRDYFVTSRGRASSCITRATRACDFLVPRAHSVSLSAKPRSLVLVLVGVFEAEHRGTRVVRLHRFILFSNT